MQEKTESFGPFTLVVHGPEIFDAGEVAWLLGTIRPVRTIVAGVMARTAAEESGLPVEFDGTPPSRILSTRAGPVVLANHAKTPASGRVFGNIIATRLPVRGLVQVECSDRTVIAWDGADRNLAAWISLKTGFPVVALSSSRDPEDGLRRIRGCISGEPVYVNGIIIGHATAGTVVIRRSGSGIGVVSGLVPKEHGLEKLARTGFTDPNAAWCKSGQIRSAPPGTGRRGDNHGRIVVIDHCGHEIYQKVTPDCCGVLAIGDDTTAVCGHVCAHRGIPVLGIIDGDRDVIVTAAFAPGSIVLETLGERDDDVGQEVARMAGNGTVAWDDWVAGVRKVLGRRVRVAVDTRGRHR